LAINDYFDIFFKDGDLASVSGIDAAIQDIRIHLSTMPGDYIQSPLIGSGIGRYFEKYKANIGLLNRLIKIEIIKLLTVAIPGRAPEQTRPSFSYVNRVFSVSVLGIDDKEKSSIILLGIEWGNLETWEGKIKLGVNMDRKPIDWDEEL
jgi:hypothetical protein